MIKIDNSVMLDTNLTRKDFPVLQRKINGRQLVYLDNAATTQKPESVISSMDDFYRYSNSNVHRGIHQLSVEATELYEDAHTKIARFINARGMKEVIFTKNATEAINLVAYAWGRKNIMEGDTILLSEMEHHSNIVPWQILAREKGARLEYIPIDDNGRLMMDKLKDLAGDRLRLVSITQMSNMLGTINPVREIARWAHEQGAIVVVDGAQSVPHFPVDVREMGCDFLAFSGHKMLGPTGIGVLYGRREILEDMEPFISGGDMIKEVHLKESKYNDLPWKFEAGTPPIAEGVGLAKAVEYLSGLGMEPIRGHERALVSYAMDRLGDIDGITIYGPPADERGGIVSFNLEGIHPHDLATLLDREAIAIRAGHHCAQPLHERLGIAASARASFYLYSTPEEVDALVDGIKKAKKIFQV
jgi:cysteine desulfurase/selenocysteine lyase